MKNNKAFTLVEVLVVVLIIGILAAIAVPKYKMAVAKANAAEALSIIKSLRPAIDEYILANGKFPETFKELTILPQGLEGKLSIQGDKIYGKNYNFVLTGCRLDVGASNPDSYEPGFLYEACENKSFPAFKTGEIYCYYLTHNTQADKRDAICRQLTNSDIEEYSTRGRAYKM